MNSIGGRLYSRNLICKTCNSELGEGIDKELSNQLSFIANMLDIKRGRGKPQNIKVIDEDGGEIYELKPGGIPQMGKPSAKINNSSNGEIEIVTRNFDEAKYILKQMEKKFPGIKTLEVFKNVRIKREYINKPLSYKFKVGGQDAFRSICKTAVNYYILNGGNRNDILHLIPYIKQQEEIDVVNFCYDSKIKIPKNEEQIIHAIVLIGDSKENILYSYIEFFNAYKYIVLMSDVYRGEDIKFVYCYDVKNGTRVEKTVHGNLTKEELIQIICLRGVPIEKFKAEYNELMKTVYKKQNSENIQRMVERAMDRSLKKHPEGVILTEEMMREFTNELMKEVGPWIAHNFN